MPRALITGIAGQDGSYLAELLAQKDYELYGLVRPGRVNDERVRGLRAIATLMDGDLADTNELLRAIEAARPDEVYNFAGITTLEAAAQDPEYTQRINAAAPLQILDALHELGADVKFCQASSTQVFGPPDGKPRDENAPVRPHNAYARAKAFVDASLRQRRTERGIFACSALLSNHESPRRPETFVSRKISLGVARIAKDVEPDLRLRSLDSARDWGYAADYVAAMHLMLQQEQPRDFVIASGVCHTVREMTAVAFAVAGIDDWEPYVVLEGPPEDRLCSPGDSAAARKDLGWRPRVGFEHLVTMMVEHDLGTT